MDNRLIRRRLSRETALCRCIDEHRRLIFYRTPPERERRALSAMAEPLERRHRGRYSHHCALSRLDGQRCAGTWNIGYWRLEVDRKRIGSDRFEFSKVSEDTRMSKLPGISRTRIALSAGALSNKIADSSFRSSKREFGFLRFSVPTLLNS